ncbi:MAG: hypothetical protein AAB416_03495, partial [Patescibacteria group bacterium]
INPSVACKPLVNPSKTRTCTTCSKDVWTNTSWSTCDDSTSKQTLEQTETFNCEADSNDEGAVGTTTYVVSGVTGTVKTKTEIASTSPKRYTRVLEVGCTPPVGGNLPTGDIKGQTLRYNGAKWEKTAAVFNFDGPKVGVGTGFSIAAAPTEILQVSAQGNDALSARLLISDPDPYAAATPNNPELQFQYATTTASGTEKNWHWSLFVDKAPGASLNSFNIWGAGYDSTTAGGGSTRLTILPNGYVGIGIATPELPLQIDHATAPFLGFRTAGAGTPANAVRFTVGARESTAANRAEIEVQSKHDLAFFTSSTLRAVISSDGSFVIGTSTQFADPAAFLVHKAAVPGTGFITGEGTSSLDAGRQIIVPSINPGLVPVPPPGSESGRSGDAQPPVYTPPAPVGGDGSAGPA